MQSGLGRPAARATRWAASARASDGRAGRRFARRCAPACGMLRRIAACCELRCGCANVGQIGISTEAPPRFHRVRVGRRAAAGRFPQVRAHPQGGGRRAPDRRGVARARPTIACAAISPRTPKAARTVDRLGLGRLRRRPAPRLPAAAARTTAQPARTPGRPPTTRCCAGSPRPASSSSPASSHRPPPSAPPSRRRRLRRRNGHRPWLARRLDARGVRHLPHLPARAAARGHGRRQRRPAARRPGPAAARPAESGGAPSAAAFAFAPGD